MLWSPKVVLQYELPVCEFHSFYRVYLGFSPVSHSIKVFQPPSLSGPKLDTKSIAVERYCD